MSFALNPYRYEGGGVPNIVIDGLILYLDAGNPSSYPGTGTDWYDQSGNSNDGTLINGVGYSSDSSGSLTFDGVNDRVLLPTNFFSYPSLTTFTISLWFKSSQISGGTLFEQQNTNNPDSAGGWIPVIYLRSDGYIRIEPFWTGSSNNFILSTSTLNDSAWHNIVTTYNSGTNQLYVDSIYNSQQTGRSLFNYTSVYYYFVGAGRSASRGLGTNYFLGNIGNFMFYNKSLTTIEIQQNFNAQRSRFGV